MARRRLLLRRALGAALGLLLLLPVLSAVTATAAYADTGTEEAQFLTLTNQLRVAHGLNALATNGELVSIARRWSGNMAAAGGISHNMSLPNQVSVYWTKLGENVGTGWDVQSIQTAFINSPHHYENLVDPAFNYVGIGVVDSGGKIYVTVDFMQYTGGQAAAPPTTRTTAAAKAPTPRPAARPPAAASAPAAAPAPAAAAPVSPTPVPVPVATGAPSSGLVIALEQVRSVDGLAAPRCSAHGPC
jgi:pyruvate/2-oxoglutarate dehydrogenase complex dihydrolipoamide acyltransferase (E2) component